jgi:hypothetical protein
VKDESEFRKGDLTAKWIARKGAQLAAEKAKRDAEKAKPIATPRRSKWKGRKLEPGEAPF